jgi:hypothetical protein
MMNADAMATSGEDGDPLDVLVTITGFEIAKRAPTADVQAQVRYRIGTLASGLCLTTTGPE